MSTDTTSRFEMNDRRSLADSEAKRKILRCQHRHPEWTPSDINEHLADDIEWLHVDYVVTALRDYRLPDDDEVFDEEGVESDTRANADDATDDTGADADDDSAAAGGADGDAGESVDGAGRVAYECAICGEEFTDAGQAKRHVSITTDAGHKDRTGDDPGVIDVHGEGSLAELNRRAAEGELSADLGLTSKQMRILEEVARRPDAPQSVIAEAFGDSVTQPVVSRAWSKVDAEWSDREEVLARMFPHIDPDADEEDDDDDDDADEPAPVKLPVEATEADLEPGELYVGTVNNVVGWGVFVSLTPGPIDGEEEEADVSGLVHSSDIPPMGSLADYEVGDTVVVELEAVTEKGPSLIMREDVDVPDGVEGPRLHVTQTARAERGNASYEGPIEGLDATMQNIGDRPVKTTAEVATAADDSEDADGASEDTDDGDDARTADVGVVSNDAGEVLASLTSDEVFAIVESDAPEDLRRRLFDAAVGGEE